MPKHDKRLIHYGAVFGLHSISYNIKYSDRFTTDQSLESLHSINPLNSVGLSAGFLFNFRINDNLDLKLNAQVGIYEYQIEYLYFNGAREIKDIQIQEPVNAEFPVMIKYKSQRRRNLRMYVTGGINPTIEASGRTKQEGNEEILLTRGSSLNLELGLGADIYYPYFKFSPEIRFSHGMVDILNHNNNRYSRGLDRMVTNSITLYIQFAG